MSAGETSEKLATNWCNRKNQIVLESFTKQRSPKLSELSKGAEIRNKLLHKPKVEGVDVGEANKYVRDVEIAIYHLLNLLYPKDPIIKTLYNREHS